MSGAGDIFGDDEAVDEGVDIPVLGPKKIAKHSSEVVLTAKPPSNTAQNLTEAEEETRAAQMRELARQTGYAGKSVFDYSDTDHRDAPRRSKTFSGNPETVLECFAAFCKAHRLEDKDALYEGFRLLGEKYDYEPLKNLPSWGNMRKK